MRQCTNPSKSSLTASPSTSDRSCVDPSPLPADLSIIKMQREGHNRLGFAVQLAYVRFPGRPLQAEEEVPASLLSYIAAQVHLTPLAFHRYAKRDTTRRQHARKIQRYLQLH